jgi:hypothetical protein
VAGYSTAESSRHAGHHGAVTFYSARAASEVAQAQATPARLAARLEAAFNRKTAPHVCLNSSPQKHGQRAVILSHVFCNVGEPVKESHDSALNA